MTDYPENAWLGYDENDCLYKVCTTGPTLFYNAPYVHRYFYEALTAERDALRAEVERLRGVLEKIKISDDLQEAQDHAFKGGQDGK